MATAKRGRESIRIVAAPEAVYDVIADVTRMGEWSPECYRCEWLDGATTAEVGARFRGYNRLGRVRWATTAVVTAARHGHEFAFTVVHDSTGRDETLWWYRFERSSGGTLLTESFDLCVVSGRQPRCRDVHPAWQPGQPGHPRDAAANRESSMQFGRAVVIRATCGRVGFRASGSRRRTRRRR
jgi:hypothetical protein